MMSRIIAARVAQALEAGESRSGRLMIRTKGKVVLVALERENPNLNRHDMQAF